MNKKSDGALSKVYKVNEFCTYLVMRGVGLFKISNNELDRVPINQILNNRCFRRTISTDSDY